MGEKSFEEVRARSPDIHMQGVALYKRLPACGVLGPCVSLGAEVKKRVSRGGGLSRGEKGLPGEDRISREGKRVVPMADRGRFPGKNPDDDDEG